MLRRVACFLSVVLAASSHAQVIDTNAQGIGRSLIDWPREMPIEFGIWFARDNWTRLAQQWDLQSRQWTHEGERRRMSAVMPIDGSDITFTQSIEGQRVEYQFKVTKPVDHAVLNLWTLSLPIESFGGGSITLDGTTLSMSAERPPEPRLGSFDASTIEIRSADGARAVRVQLDQVRQVSVQDAREWGSPSYQLMVTVHDGLLVQGQTIDFRATLTPSIRPDDSPATITIDPTDRRQPFHGIGGNFVYAIEARETELNLQSLRLDWARIGMDVRAWEPVNDNDDASITSSQLAARDVQGSSLRRRFEVDRAVFARSGPRLIASIWHLPEWLYKQPVEGWRDRAGRVPRDRWDELAECVTSYLLHLRDRYGVEPAMFSFNENDVGVYVLLDAQEHRDMTILLGRAFERAGLKTGILAGDSASLERGIEQIQPTLDDPQAMKYVKALGHHPWSGEARHWQRWVDAARRAGVPLLATEAGVDASSYQDQSYNWPINTIRQMGRWVDLIDRGGVSALLEWEYTADYSLWIAQPDGSLKPSGRHAMLSLLGSGIGPSQTVIGTSSSLPQLSSAAWVDDAGGMTVVLLNRADERLVRIKGLTRPDGRIRAKSVAHDGRSAAVDVVVVEGEGELVMPAASMLVLHPR